MAAMLIHFINLKFNRKFLFITHSFIHPSECSYTVLSIPFQWDTSKPMQLSNVLVFKPFAHLEIACSKTGSCSRICMCVDFPPDFWSIHTVRKYLYVCHRRALFYHFSHESIPISIKLYYYIAFALIIYFEVFYFLLLNWNEKKMNPHIYIDKCSI